MKYFLLPLILLMLWGCSARKLKWNKVTFHTSGCFGTCPVYHLEVKSDHSYRLYKEVVYKKNFSYEQDDLKTGYFSGHLSDSTFKKLDRTLANVGLDSLEFDGETCCDGSLITIIADYNGKRKFMKSMFPPSNAEPLISCLYEICSTEKVTRSKSSFTIENREF